MGIIRTLLAVAGLFFAVELVANDRPVITSDFSEVQTKVKSIISDQIDAFNSLDVDRAYSHASASIKAIFPNSTIFGNMVEKSYPMIWNPKSFEFLSISGVRTGVVQRVLFTDQQGDIHFFDYVLENNGERWVISGVYMIQGEKGV